jgi:hypothetical protein
MGSNHQPTPYEGAALPLSYGPKERATGFGPAMSAWKADALPLGDARWKNRFKRRAGVYLPCARTVKQTYCL